MTPHKINWLNQPGFKGKSINPIRARVKLAARVTWSHLGNRKPEPIVDTTERFGTHCEKVGPGCVNCYAEAHNRRCLPNGGTGLPYTRESRDKVEIYLDEDKLDKVHRWKKPRCIFWCSLTDLFGEWVPDDMIEQCLDVMAKTPQHRHIVLTKRVARLWGPMPRHIWVLASASTQETAAQATRQITLCGADVVGLSLEPLLGPITIPEEYLEFLSWVIVGCESGPRRRPCKDAWVRSIVQQCRDADTRCFVKQMSIAGRVSRDPAEWPKDLRVQQFPEV